MLTRDSLKIAYSLAVLVLLASGCAPSAAPAPGAASPPSSPQAQAATAKPAQPATAPSPTPKPASDQPRSGGILKHAAYKDEGTFDLHLTGRNLAAEQVGVAYSGLLQYDPEDGTKIIPDLAEGFQVSQDGKKITFPLRKNIKWHDGKAFTAEDVKFNFDRWMKPPEGVAITRKEIVAAVERVETPDANTVEIYLKYPTPAFVGGIAMVSAVMMPPQYLKDHKAMEYNVLGTGPFKLKKYNRGASLEFVKNESYFVAGRPYLDGVTQYLVADETARFAAFRTGQVRTMCTFVANITPSHAELLRKDMSDKVNVARFAGMTMAVLYVNSTRPPFNDVRVRQAVDMALDRKKAVEVAEGKADIIGPMIRGPWALPDDELLKRPGYKGVTPQDIEKAKAVLAEAGYPKGFQVDAMTDEPYTKQTVFVQDQLKAIGIDVSIKVVDNPSVEKRRLSADFVMNVGLPGHPIDEPDLYLSFWVTGGGRNYGGFSDKQVDDWYLEQSRTMDAAKRKEIVLNTQRRILDLAGIPVLYHALQETPYWKCVRGYYPEKRLGGYSDVKKQDVWLTEGCQ